MKAKGPIDIVISTAIPDQKINDKLPKNRLIALRKFLPLWIEASKVRPICLGHCAAADCLP